MWQNDISKMDSYLPCCVHSYETSFLEIRREIEEIEKGILDRENNPLKNAPHTMELISADNWALPYSRQRAAFPLVSFSSLSSTN